MRKTLGPLIEVIPPEYQESLAKIMAVERCTSIHRGMLSFIPFEEMMMAILKQNSLNYSSAMQLLAQHQQQYQQAMTQQYQGLTATHFPIGNWQQTAGTPNLSSSPYGAPTPRATQAPLFTPAIYNHLLVLLTTLAAVIKMEEVKVPPDDDEDEIAPPEEKALSYL